MNFKIKEEILHYPVAKTKALISCAVIAKRISIFAFAYIYENILFSHIMTDLNFMIFTEEKELQYTKYVAQFDVSHKAAYCSICHLG